MNFLVDTNVFLEILLNQPASQKCQDFLNRDPGAGWIFDFSLHSIGVLLFRKNKSELFSQFVADTLPNITVLSLSTVGYTELATVRDQYGLDFDDAYQFCVAKESGLAISTQDKDFQRVKGIIDVRFI